MLGQRTWQARKIFLVLLSDIEIVKIFTFLFGDLEAVFLEMFIKNFVSAVA